MKVRMLAFAASLFVVSSSVSAAVCDYTPSHLMGANASTAAGVTTGAVAATGVGLKAAGVYTITHATTGAAMLGSTAAGASGAGTVGIIAGTGGFLGTVGAVLMSPFVIVPAAVAAAGIGIYEGACYFTSGDESEE